MNNIFIIRSYEQKDREALRKISCDTAFMGEPCEVFFEGREFLADLLTLYFTDYEPESCFVAETDNVIAGYLTGAMDSNNIKRIFFYKILPGLLKKYFFKGIIFRKKNILFIFHIFKSFLKGEFKNNVNLKEYPALLHINIDSKYRKINIGTALIENYFNYLKSKGINGIHLNAKSEHAAVFFVKMGFFKLQEIKRTYFEYINKKPFIYYYFTKKITITGREPFS